MPPKNSSNVAGSLEWASYRLTLMALVIAIGSVSLASGASNRNYHQRDGLHVPCTFFDTVNVTDDRRFDNGSYLHDNLIIPAHYVGVFDYIYVDLVQRVEVEPHMRGCVCKLRPCINLCCPWGSVLNITELRCVETEGVLQWPERKLNVTWPDGEVRRVDIYQQFAVQNFRPCMKMYALQPEMYSGDAWSLFPNGTMLRLYDQEYIGKNEYCMVATDPLENDTVFIINPANCGDEENTTMKVINAYTMLFSIPFMVLTIVVYLSIPELCNQHGKSLVCYLFGLSMGYTLLSCIILKNEFDSLPCKLIGYTTYFFFMVAFFWLNVISFDLWHNFRGTRGMNRFQENRRFLLYSLYSWGCPLLMLVGTVLAQEVFELPEYLQPGIGTVSYCWLNMQTWSAMIYFYGPVLFIISANMVMFVMTALKIHKVQREMSRIIAREDSARNLRSEKDKFGLFLRLFLVMGVTWSVEIISYFVGNENFLTKFFYITDICNAIQGFLIFMLFVMKRKVKHLITNRYSSIRHSNTSNQRQSQYSTKTTSSSVANLSTTGTNLNHYEKPLINQERNTTKGI